MYEKTVLSFGYRKEILNAAKNLNYEIVSLIDDWDQPEQLPKSEQYETRIYTQNNIKIEGIIGALSRANQLKFDGVCSSFEYFVVNASLLSQFLSTPFISPLTAIAFRNKYYQKQLLSLSGIDNDFWLFDLKTDDIPDFSNLFPIVVKPIAGGGTEDTFIIRNTKELESKMKFLKEKSITKLFIEGFNEGEEYHIDGWISKNKLGVFSISKYGKPCINIQEGWVLDDVMLRPEEHRELYEQIKDYLELTLDALKLTDSVFHMELFYDSSSKKIKFGECAARIPGNYIAETFKQMFKIDLYEILLQISVGDEVLVPSGKQTAGYYGYTFIPNPPTKENSLPRRENVLNLKGVVKVKYEWKNGEELPNSKEATSNRVGMVLLKAESEEALNERINFVQDYFQNHYNLR